MMPLASLAVAAVLFGPQAPPSEEMAQLALELRGLRGGVALLELQLRKREESLDAMGRDLRAMAAEVAGLKGGTAPVSAPFLAGPPPSSDTVGVAKTVVFAPRLEAEATRRRDIVFLKVRRIEAGELRAVASLEMSQDQLNADLPIDQSGALYVVDWSTSEGHSYNLVLKDGATGLPAATVQVKPLQNEGRFLFVGYRME